MGSYTSRLVICGFQQSDDAKKQVIQWSADDCVDNLSSLGAGAYCRICDVASKGCAAMAFLSIATGLVNIWTVPHLLFQHESGLIPFQ